LRKVSRRICETNKQIERLDQVFTKLGQKPSGTECRAIDGLIKESNETAGEIDDKSVLDAAIVANAQAASTMKSPDTAR
jgi:ferritin-like metal-binding protein YciE